MGKDIKGVDNGRRNIKLGQAGFIDMGSLSRHSTFNVAAPRVRKGLKQLVLLVVCNLDQKVDHSG